MKRISALFSTTLLALFCISPAFAGWWDVRPGIQQPDTTGFGAEPFALRDTVFVVYIGDSLYWAAEELSLALEAEGLVSIPMQLPSLYHMWGATAQDYDQIVLTTYGEEIDTLVAAADVLGGRLNGFGGSEEYRMWVQDSIFIEDVFEPGENVVGIVWASTVRGMLYAVTTLKAVLDSVSADSILLPPGLARDFPTFPRRIIGEPFDLSSASPWATPTAHAVAILEGARDLLLENKGNGFIQFGKEDSASAVFQRLAVGDTLSDHVDTWQDLSMDWYQGIGKWGGATDAQKKRSKASAYIYKEVHFGGIDSDHGVSGTEIIPNSTEYPQVNFDFEDDLDRFDWWRDVEGWTTPFEGTNFFALSPNMGANGTAHLSRFMQLQDSVGLPMRQLVLEFRVRTVDEDDSVEVWIESLMPPDSNGFDLTDDDNYEEGDFRIFDAKHHSKKLRFKHTVTSTSWDTLSVLFYSFGLKYDLMTFWFKNVGGGSARVEFDGIRLYESDNYFLHVVETNGRLDTDFATFILDSMGPSGWTEVGALNATSLRLQELQTANCDARTVWWHPRLRVVLDMISPYSLTLSDLANSPDFRGRFYYHAACPAALPAFFDTLAPLQVFYLDSGQTDTCAKVWVGYREVIHDAEEYSGSLAGKVRSIHDIWNSVGPATPFKGSFNRYNENRFLGWSLMDTLLSSSNDWTLADMYADFNAHIADRINDSLNASIPLLLYADMFNPYHNGQRLSRVNNPFASLGGYRMDSTNFSAYSEDQPLVFVDWWSKDVRDTSQAIGIVNAYTNVLDTTNDNWEAMFTFLPETRVTDIGFDSLFPLYMGIATASIERRERGYNFSGGGLLYDVATMSPDWTEFENREEFLQLWWKNDPVSFPETTFVRTVQSGQLTQNATFKSYPVPYPEDHTVEIDSVVLQYRFRGNTSWSTQEVAFQSDSLYDFSLSLPDSGGYAEYRVWSFDDLGRYGSYPPYGTKWTDPDAGERDYFTFERRKDDAIVKPDTFWLPCVITKEHKVAPNGKLVFQPLPGYKHATLYVGDDAKVTTTWVGSGSARPEIKFNGTDTSYIHVKPLCDTCIWKGIFDSIGVVVQNHVTFHDGTGEALVLKDATGDSKAQFNSASFEDTVRVKGPAEITGKATFNKLIVDSGGTLTVLPGSEIAFFEGGQLIVKAGGQLKAFGNDSTEIVFNAAVDSLPWEGIHCEVDSQMAACSLAYVDVSGAVAGVLVDHARGYAEHCTFTQNKYGVLVNNGAWFEAKECSLTTNEIGCWRQIFRRLNSTTLC